jgi:hypothetical protein
VSLAPAPITPKRTSGMLLRPLPSHPPAVVAAALAYIMYQRYLVTHKLFPAGITAGIRCVQGGGAGALAQRVAWPRGSSPGRAPARSQRTFHASLHSLASFTTSPPSLRMWLCDQRPAALVTLCVPPLPSPPPPPPPLQRCHVRLLLMEPGGGSRAQGAQSSVTARRAGLRVTGGLMLSSKRRPVPAGGRDSAAWRAAGLRAGGRQQAQADGCNRLTLLGMSSYRGGRVRLPDRGRSAAPGCAVSPATPAVLAASCACRAPSPPPRGKQLDTHGPEDEREHGTAMNNSRVWLALSAVGVGCGTRRPAAGARRGREKEKFTGAGGAGG